VRPLQQLNIKAWRSFTHCSPDPGHCRKTNTSRCRLRSPRAENVQAAARWGAASHPPGAARHAPKRAQQQNQSPQVQRHPLPTLYDLHTAGPLHMPDPETYTSCALAAPHSFRSACLRTTPRRRLDAPHEKPQNKPLHVPPPCCYTAYPRAHLLGRTSDATPSTLGSTATALAPAQTLASTA